MSLHQTRKLEQKITRCLILWPHTLLTPPVVIGSVIWNAKCSFPAFLCDVFQQIKIDPKSKWMLFTGLEWTSCWLKLFYAGINIGFTKGYYAKKYHYQLWYPVLTVYNKYTCNVMPKYNISRYHFANDQIIRHKWSLQNKLQVITRACSNFFRLSHQLPAILKKLMSYSMGSPDQCPGVTDQIHRLFLWWSILLLVTRKCTMAVSTIHMYCLQFRLSVCPLFMLSPYKGLI